MAMTFHDGRTPAGVELHPISRTVALLLSGVKLR